jgi:hypothetical protein
MSPARVPPAVLLPGASLPSAGSSGARVPRIRRYYGALRLPAARLAALRCLRATIPRRRSRFRSRRAANGSLGEPEVGNPVSSSGKNPRRRQDLLRSWAALVPLPCSPTPVDPTHQAVSMRRCGPRYDQNEGVHIRSFEAQSHGFSTRCLRFAGRVAPPPRKTRFRPPAKRYRVGLITYGAAIEGFRNHVMSFPPPSPSLVAQGHPSLPWESGAAR